MRNIHLQGWTQVQKRVQNYSALDTGAKERAFKVKKNPENKLTQLKKQKKICIFGKNTNLSHQTWQNTFGYRAQVQNECKIGGTLGTSAKRK